MKVNIETAREDHRLSERDRVDAAAAVRGDRVRDVANVEDISRFGARLKTSQPLAVGTLVSLKLAFTDTIAATIVWADDCTAGCEFSQPLDTPVYEVLRRALR